MENSLHRFLWFSPIHKIALVSQADRRRSWLHQIKKSKSMIIMTLALLLVMFNWPHLIHIIITFGNWREKWTLLSINF